MRFQDSKFYDLKEISHRFDKFLLNINYDLGSDLIKDAIILEQFLINYFKLKINFQIDQGIFIARKYIERISKSFQRSSFSFETQIFNENDFQYSEIISNILSDEKSEDLDLKIINILFEERNSWIKYKYPIFDLAVKIDFNDLIDTKYKNYLTNDFNFHWEKGSENMNYASFHANYCLKCHTRNKDSCRNGFLDHKTNQLENELHGCPLEQHISEAIWLFESNNLLAALIAMMINNPLLALTGYRICNDCSKACIFQKQTQVDVPTIETTIFDTLIKMPFGVEIYLLLLRWHPLKIYSNHKVSNAPNDKKILVAGLGPAGISASYFLLHAGYKVVAIDALKIEKLPSNLVHNLHEDFHFIDLEERTISGFGGVMEYGITSRWNKNYLTIMQIFFERHKDFEYLDGVRLGSSYSIDDAFQDNFHHIILACGTGRQQIPGNVPNFLFKNVRLGSDFLMNLNLGGAYKFDERYLTNNLIVEMPAMVLGGGLTAIDVATEILNYYPRQVLKVDRIINKFGLEKAKFILDIKDDDLINKFFYHASKIKECYDQESLHNFLESIGGVSILYHRKIQDSKAYKLNHQELQIAINKGVKFIEDACIEKLTIESDEVREIILKNKRMILVKNLFIACGSKINTQLLEELGISKEEILNFISRDCQNLKEFESCLIKNKVSVIGDMHPKYKGSVVKAILSGKLCVKEIEQI
jgi:NADPH-dependent glutamate synthase beta subunit-like oxidoreductase